MEEYLALFDPGAPDTALLRGRAERLLKVVVRRYRGPAGREYEDTEFTEKGGVSYVIRSVL